MYPDVKWENEPDLEELYAAYSLLDSNADLAVSRLEHLANIGSIASMWYLGDAYSSGRVLNKELDKSLFWYSKAEASGWIPASYRIGRIYFDMRDYESALKAFTKGMSNNYVPAIYRLAMMHCEGLGTQEDIGECRKLLLVAVSKGHLFAKRDLATLYIKGSFGLVNIPRGIYMLSSLILNLFTINIKREWKSEAFDDRILA